MAPRRVFVTLTACTLLPALSLKAVWADEHQQRPSIVLVFVDDMGWADFSCFGNTDAKTLHVDRLAAEGIALEQFYVNSPICSPSRVAISTGQYPQRWRITSYLAHHEQNTQRGTARSGWTRRRPRWHAV